MINVGFTNIDNAKLVGRLLPFWARGRRLSMFIQGILTPLASIHAKFRAWALERFIECHITAQKPSLEWYLKYKLKERLADSSDSFYISQGINESVSCFSFDNWHNAVHWDNDLRWGVNAEPLVNMNMNLTCFNTGQWENGNLWNNALGWTDEADVTEYDDYAESFDQTRVYAPAIAKSPEYSAEDYERDILSIMAHYMTSFNKIKVIIANE